MVGVADAARSKPEQHAFQLIDAGGESRGCNRWAVPPPIAAKRCVICLVRYIQVGLRARNTIDAELEVNGSR
jgi:hypothetical protein